MILWANPVGAKGRALELTWQFNGASLVKI
jgi:hypothetical protein